MFALIPQRILEGEAGTLCALPRPNPGYAWTVSQPDHPAAELQDLLVKIRSSVACIRTVAGATNGVSRHLVKIERQVEMVEMAAKVASRIRDASSDS